MIFDIEQMKRTLIEFEIDTEKMPLGKLSRKQIETGYSILTEALGMLKTGSGSEVKFIDCTNRFFTLIPHDFGLNSPPSKPLSGRHALLELSERSVTSFFRLQDVSSTDQFGNSCFVGS